jgi:hypothetical protein
MGCEFKSRTIYQFYESIMTKGSEAVKRTRKRLKLGMLEAFESKCGICGYQKYNGALELHHLDPAAKDFEFGKNTTRSFEFLCSEAEKCVCLCSNCHREVPYWDDRNTEGHSSFRPFQNNVQEIDDVRLAN